MSQWEPSIGATDEWYTPAYIFEALGCFFDLDVAAPVGGPKHVPCLTYYYERGLERDWHGVVWANPPFGGRNGLEPWLDKFARHGNGIALTPDRTSAPWFQRMAAQADAILFLSPKVKFERPDGSLGNSPGTGTALFAMGDEGVAALTRGRRLGFLCKGFDHEAA